MTTNDGGQAFPGPTQHEQREDINQGMTLRQYYAGQALVAVAMRYERRWDELANDCVNIADALIARLEY